jgi:hypothetical protein
VCVAPNAAARHPHWAASSAYLPRALESLAETEDVQIVIMGDGEDRYVKEVQEITRMYPEKSNTFSLI